MAVFVPFRLFKGAAAPNPTVGRVAAQAPRSVPTAAWTANQAHRPVCSWKIDPPKDR